MYRIGFDATLAFKNHYGPGHYSRSTIRYLTRQYPFNEYFLYSDSFRAHPLHQFAQFHNIAVNKHGGCKSRYLPLIGDDSRLAKRVAKDGVELWHGLNGNLPKWDLQIPLVVTIHNLIHLRHPHFYSKRERVRVSRIADKTIESADKIVAVSRQTADDIVEFYNVDNSKIEVIHQSCDPQFYKSASEEEIEKVAKEYNFPKRFMVAVGTIEERKNLEAVVRALPKLPESLHLYAIGRWTPYAEKVKEVANSLGVGERLVMIHDAHFWQLPAIYSLAEALIYVSIYESFGMPVLEGITYGVPVITSGGSTMIEAGGDAALYVNPDSPSDIADKIELLLSSPTLKHSLIERGYSHAKQFRTDKVAERLYTLYQTLLKG